MPLYFFNYETLEAEEIIDLKDYSVDSGDIRGRPEDFIVRAIGDDDELELRFVKP